MVHYGHRHRCAAVMPPSILRTTTSFVRVVIVTEVAVAVIRFCQHRFQLQIVVSRATVVVVITVVTISTIVYR